MIKISPNFGENAKQIIQFYKIGWKKYNNNSIVTDQDGIKLDEDEEHFFGLFLI